MTRIVRAPDNIVDQIWHDLSKGLIPGDILVTQEQIDEANSPMLRDGGMLLGRRVRLTDGEPSSKYPPEVPSEERTIQGIQWK